MAYDEEEYLQLSGLQHFSFCRRQWVLIHIEGQWLENLRTMEGHFLHEKAHDSRLSEKRGNTLISRGLPVSSRELGVTGACDVVEFSADDQGVTLAGRAGKWQPCPVEYKRGSSKTNDADRLQLCCQAMCLEEMLVCRRIETAFLYYGETRRREAVDLTDSLRRNVVDMLQEMHRLFRQQHTPRVKPAKHCNACSLKIVCMPALLSRTGSAAQYIRDRMEETL